MTNNFWKKADYVVGLLPFMAIFAVLVVSANIEIKDLDLWLHLAMGKFITLNGYIPRVDMLSNSIQGTPWVNHEWFFQVIVFSIYNNWGAEGLILMQVIIVSLTMLLLLFLGYTKERQLLTTIILFLLYMVFQQRFTIRPDLYSLFFFSMYIFVLSLHIDKKWAVPVLFIVQVFWSNIHGFFFFGPLFVMIGIVSEYVKRRVALPYQWNESGRLTDEEYRRLKRLFLFVIGACLINPMFVKGAWYPVSVFFSLSGENKIFFNHIQELSKPITWDTLFEFNRYVYFKMLIAFSFVSFIFNRRRIDISALLFWIVFLVFSLNASRNTPFFAFAAYLVIMTNFLHINYNDIIPMRFSEKKFLYLTTILLKLLFLIWIIGYYQTMSMRSYYDFDKYELKSEYRGISQRSFPDKAADFLIDNKVQGNFFNDFNSGAYLLGRTFPDIKVFIDGRTEVYGGTFFKKYQEIWEKGNSELFEKIVEQHNITGAFLNSTRHHIPEKILNYIYMSDEWHVVYFDYDAVIFLKNVEANKALINKHKIDLAKWKPPQVDLLKLGPLRVKPYQPYYRGYTLESLDLEESALRELNQAIEVDPLYADAHDLIGKIYAQRKNFNKAFEHFRLAVSTSKGNKEMHHNLAFAYFDLGEYKGAIKQYEKINFMWPDDPKGFFLLAKVLIMDQQYSEALKSLNQAHKKEPEDVKDLLELGDLFFKKNAYLQAGEAYRMALSTGKEAGKVHEKLGRVSLKLDDFAQALIEFEKALLLDPNNEEIKVQLRQLR